MPKSGEWFICQCTKLCENDQQQQKDKNPNRNTDNDVDKRNHQKTKYITWLETQY